MDKTEKPNEKDREEQEGFWLTLEPLPAPDPEKPSAPHEERSKRYFHRRGLERTPSVKT